MRRPSRLDSTRAGDKKSMAAFVPTYTSDDVAPVVVDTGVKTLVQVNTFATILGLGAVILLLIWIGHKMKKAGR